MKIALATLFLMILMLSGFSQENSRPWHSHLSSGLFQVKERANFGLVFKGAGFQYGIGRDFGTKRGTITFGSEVGVSILFSRQIPGLGIYLKPFEAAYLFEIPLKNQHLLVGPSLMLEYNYNMYPDLQSGFDYWFTDISAGLAARYDFRIRKADLQLSLNTSLAGFISRQPDKRDPYFYDIGFKHAVKHLHQDLTFGLAGDYNITSFEIRWKPAPDSRLTYAYTLRYSGFYGNPEISMLNHSVKLIFNRKHA
ncbi:MAG: hypothetical protein AB9834_03560 [Lentimicrobium sp.]